MAPLPRILLDGVICWEIYVESLGHFEVITVTKKIQSSFIRIIKH